MKKSKIIAPALAVLTLSTAAAVTGTVAWFTANRMVTVNNTALTAYNPESGLKVELSGAKACTLTVDEGDGDTTAVVTHENLRDASVDFSSVASPKVWGSVLNDAGEVSGHRDVSTAALAGTAAGTYGSPAKSYYWCSIYTATFSLEAGASSENYDLKYDNTKLVTTNANTLAIAPALRMAIVYQSNVQVIAPFRAAGDVAYANGTAEDATGTYAAVGSDKTGTFALGQLQGSGTQSATIYTWFEGEDEACVNNNVDVAKSVTVSLGFTISLHQA